MLKSTATNTKRIKRERMSEMKENFTAATVEEAKKMAAESFGVELESIEFTVIEEPKKTLFGKLKGDAVVQAEYNPPTKRDVAVKYITDVLTAMGIENLSVEATETEDELSLEINGDDFDKVVGKKGEILDALQYLSSLVCNKIDREYYRISTDSSGFRERRKATLEKVALKYANNAKRASKTLSLEPMNPYERRIIHAKISEIEGVTSRSVGEEPYRKVLICPTEKRYNSRGGKGRGGYRKNSGRPNNRRQSDSYATSFEKEYKKPKPEDDMDLGSGLYGKIEF